MRRIVFGITICLILTYAAYAKGLEVFPPLCRFNVQAGIKSELPVPIEIFNNSSTVRTYTLQAKTPSSVNAEVDPGFEEILETIWVVFETSELDVMPQTTSEVRVFITVPKESNNLGRNWMFYIEVLEKPPPGDRFALACYPKIYVKTATN